MAEKSSRTYFPDFDSLRFFAFWVVLVFHFRLHCLNPSHTEWSLKIALGFLTFFLDGISGVSFFFVLSGFLITNLILEECKRLGSFSLYNFYVRRTLRIWPLYYLGVCIGLAMLAPNSTLSAARTSLYLLFFANYDPIWFAYPGSPVLGVLWSLSVEEQFYLVWPLTLWLSLRKFPVPANFLKQVLTIVIFLSFLCRCYWAYINPFREALLFDTFCVMSDLAVGSLGAVLASEARAWKTPLSSKIRVALVYVAGLAALAFSSKLGFSPTQSPLGRILLSAFFLFVLIEQSYGSHSPFKLRRLRLAGFLGKYTYGLYMYHMIALTLVNKMFSQEDIGLLSGLLRLGIAFLLTFTIAFASFHLFEQRLLSIKERFSR